MFAFGRYFIFYFLFLTTYLNFSAVLVWRWNKSKAFSALSVCLRPWTGWRWQKNNNLKLEWLLAFQSKLQTHKVYTYYFFNKWTIKKIKKEKKRGWGKNEREKTLFFMAKHNMRSFGVSPYFKLKNNTETTVKWWKWDVGHLSAFGWAIFCYTVLVSSVWKNVGRTGPPNPASFRLSLSLSLALIIIFITILYCVLITDRLIIHILYVCDFDVKAVQI